MGHTTHPSPAAARRPIDVQAVALLRLALSARDWRLDFSASMILASGHMPYIFLT
jgi:hypothetical protein